MKKLLLRPEAFVYFTLAVFGSIFAALFFGYNQAFASDFLSYTLGRDMQKVMWIFAAFGTALAVHFAVFRRRFSGLSPFFRSLLFMGIPVLLSFFVLVAAVGQLNTLNSTRLKDQLLFQWDTFLTGTFLPLSAGSVQYPSWFVQAVAFSYTFLVPAFVLLALYLLRVNQKLFREAAAVFSIGSLLLLAGWVMFPVLSPHDRFIDNVYQLPIPPAIQQYVGAYSPQAEIQSFLAGMRDLKEKLEFLPTSTFPSGHAAWGVWLVYFAWRVRPKLLFAVVPLVTLSSVGTFLFAQHYFVDVPAGIAVATLSVFVVRWALRARAETPAPQRA
ncbi:MAG TPA: phosphatase PAP2 family protein [Candidatus Paceibacterota bacterium]|nr:phosphatase PAP2 family protein [Candidatus Paceibacterota bacterium]